MACCDGDGSCAGHPCDLIERHPQVAAAVATAVVAALVLSVATHPEPNPGYSDRHQRCTLHTLAPAGPSARRARGPARSYMELSRTWLLFADFKTVDDR